MNMLYILIIADFKMKLLAILYRESMQQFFGKRGIAWHGLMFITLIPGETEALQVFIINDLSDDAKEDGFLVASALEDGLRIFKKENAHIEEAILMTDGAGAYSGALLLGHLPNMAQNTGISVKENHIGEAGQGKSELDASFAVNGSLLKSNAASGNFDVTDATSAVLSLNSGPVSKGTFNSELIPNRKFHTKVKPGAIPGLTLCSHRSLSYDASGKFLGVTLRHQSYLGDGEFLSAAKLVKIWKGAAPHTTGSTAIHHAPNNYPSKVSNRVKVIGDKKKKADQDRQLKRQKTKNKRKEKSHAEAKKYGDSYMQSGIFCCPVDGCSRDFLSKFQLNQHIQSGEHTTGVTTDRKGKLKIGNQPMNATKIIFDLVTSREEREAADAFSWHKLDIRRRKSQLPMIWECIDPLFQGMLQQASWV